MDGITASLRIEDPRPARSELPPEIERVLFTAEQIQARVRELAAAIAGDYLGCTPVIVGVLKGSVFFLSDLVRSINMPVRVDFLGISSFASTRNNGRVRIEKDLDLDVAGERVLLVEDIVDTGFTLQYLLDALKARRPASLATCALLDKPARRIIEVPVDYRCFEVPDRFIIGYGLDYQQLYRNLPYLAVMRPEAVR
jgi:hypoxanthine phosphoribosyltransferase